MAHGYLSFDVSVESRILLEIYLSSNIEVIILILYRLRTIDTKIYILRSC